MFAAALIVFREVLEAALVVTVVMAATRGLLHRGRWVGIGIASGVTGAALVAALARVIATSFEGAGQEIVNASILFIAVGLISWHVIWMNSHGRKIAHEMRAKAKSVMEGERHMAMLAVVVGLAVMREGSEIVLILQGLWSNESSSAPMIIGSFVGLAFGVAVGALLYFGMLALSVSRLFALTNSVLVLIAAGMAAHAANFLNQADLLPALGTRLWDTSFILSDDGVIGKALGALVGYIARPSGIEVLFYAATVAIVLGLIKITHLNTFKRRVVPVITFALIGGGLLLPHAVRADEVMSPYIAEHEWEFEQEGIATTHDKNPENSGAQDFEASIGYSPTAWYRTELETEFQKVSGMNAENLHYQSFNWLNTIALAEPGEFWFDPAIFFEADFAKPGNPNNVIFGLIGAKQFGRVLTTVNLFGHKEYGDEAGPITGFAYSDQTKYLWKVWMQPGFEVFGDTDGQTQLQDQHLAIGPGIFGQLGPALSLTNGNDIKYEATYLFGATRASPSQAVRWKLEYEFFF